jgi:AcrR family transcriptional regulator
MVKPSGKEKSSNRPLDNKATEAKILTSARTEFIGKGKAGARMQAIALNAGVNKALLHYYFRSKDQLYAAALKEILH